jgi:hypothetical protein
VERTRTEIDSALFEVVHRLAAGQGREDSEVLEDAVSYYLLSLGDAGPGPCPRSAAGWRGVDSSGC